MVTEAQALSPITFVHPEFHGTAVTDYVPDPTLTTYQRTAHLLKEFRQIAEDASTHPLIVAKEARLTGVDNALHAQAETENRTRSFGYVSDIHGLNDEQFQKLRDTLAQGNFDQVFFIGDIGGSEHLAKLQRLYYQGEDNLTGKVGVNKYKELQKEGADDARILQELKGGYLNMYQYVKVLEKHGNLLDEEAREMAEQLTDEQILEGIKWIGKHRHYGHFVSDTQGGIINDHVIATLAADVESYYDRFAHMIAELHLNSKTRTFVLQGNWDARLPFDFKAGTDTPEPLDPEQRRFNESAFFKKKGIPYFTRTGLVETDQAVHVMVPFDSVAKDVDSEKADLTTLKINRLSRRLEKARNKRKNIVMVTHAVPAWERHGRTAAPGEAQTTERNLQKLVGELHPDQVIYGHEHAWRKGTDGQLIDLDTRYRLTSEDGAIQVGTDEHLEELDKRSDGVVAVHLPIPAIQNFNGIATMELPTRAKNFRSRGNGGKNSPLRVGREVVILKKVSEELPTQKILTPVR